MERPKTLEGVTVLDLSRLLPGPLATSILADHGARVIELNAGVSSKEAVSRIALPTLHRLKETINLDIRTPRGHELFLELVKRSDVLVEGFRPASAKGMGVDYATVVKANPRIISCSITGYGQTGPMSDKAGHDINYISVSGVADLLTPEGAEPHVPGIQLADVFGGSIQAVVGILLALRWRDVSGRGQHLDIDMTEGSKALATLAYDLLNTGMPYRAGESFVGGGIGCYGYYKASDGKYLAVGALESKHFTRLCKSLGAEDLVQLQYDTDRQGELRKRLQEIFSRKTAREWEAELIPQDVCVTRVRTFIEAVEADGLRTCEQPEKVAEASGGGLRFGSPVQLCEPIKPDAEGTSRSGIQTEKVLKEIGLGDDEIADLRGQGIIS